MTSQPVKTSTIVKAFASIGVPAHELALLDPGAAFGREMVPVKNLFEGEIRNED